MCTLYLALELLSSFRHGSHSGNIIVDVSKNRLRESFFESIAQKPGLALSLELLVVV